MFGIINVYKPKGMTSHDVVSFMRRTLHMKRIGHTGTLDPDAEGVLPVLVGKATKLSDLLMAEEKCYFAGVKLGIVTDTDDIGGEVIRQCDASVTQAQVEEVVSGFVGKSEQIPPMYSAIKVNGQKLYQLARKGVVTERKSRKIEIYSLDMQNFDGDSFQLRVHCSKGTYIRALCRDIGEALGTGATMSSLVREQSGMFTLENVHTFEEITEAAENGTIEHLLISPDDVLGDLLRADVDDETIVKVKNGIRLRPEQLGIKAIKEQELVRIYCQNELICVQKAVECDGQLLMAMEKSFYEM